MSVNDTWKAWLHQVTGTTPAGGLTLNDLLARLNNDTNIILAGELRLKNTTTGKTRKMYLDDDNSIADEDVP